MTREVIIPNLLNKNNFTVGVEIGSLKGEFAKTILSQKYHLLNIYSRIALQTVIRSSTTRDACTNSVFK